MRPEPIRPVPDETVRVAKGAFPKGTTYTRMRDELGSIFEDGETSRICFPPTVIQRLRRGEVGFGEGDAQLAELDLEEGGNACQICGLDRWLGEPIMLEMHRKKRGKTLH